MSLVTSCQLFVQCYISESRILIAFLLSAITTTKFISSFLDGEKNVLISKLGQIQLNYQHGQTPQELTYYMLLCC